MPEIKKVEDTNKSNLLEQDFKATKPKEKWVGEYNIYLYKKKSDGHIFSNCNGFTWFKNNWTCIWKAYDSNLKQHKH